MDSDIKAFIDKFHVFLREIVNSKNVEMININTKLDFYCEIKKFKDTKNVSHLINIDSDLLDENVKKLIELILYLEKENLESIPQFTDAVNKLLGMPLFSTCDSIINEFNNKKKLLGNEIKEINKILLNDNYDINVYASLLKESGLDADEQVLVLCDIVSASCPDKKEEIIEPSKEIISEESFDFEELKNDAKQFYEDYYYIIGSDSDDIKSERKGSYYIIDMLINNEEFELNKSNFEVLAILLYELKNLLIKLENANTDSINNLVELKELATKTTNYVTYGKYLVGELKKLRLPKGEEAVPKNNIIYLTGDEDQTLFNIKNGEFSNDEIKLAASAIKKLSNSGPEDDDRIVKGVTGNSRKIFAIRSSNVVCTYMRLSNNIVLVITIGKNGDIYNETIQAVKKYREKIGYLEGASYFKPQMLLESELKISDEIKEAFISTGITK